MKRILGFFVFGLGILLGGWIAYNLLIERQPATQGRNPIPAILMSVAFLYVGYKWMRG